MEKEVLFGSESRAKTLLGVKKITDAVRVTMGASGKCVLIGNAVYNDRGVMVQLPTTVTKDGWTVAKNFELSDPVENRGAMMIIEAATKTVEEAGDATTCTCVLAESLISGGIKLIDAGANSQMVKKGMDAALKYTIDELNKISTPVRGDLERVRQIATVSANNDKAIGDLIAEAVQTIGFDGIINVEESKNIETTIKVSGGYKIEHGWESALFVNNRSKETCEFENALILLYDKKIIHHTQVEKAISLANQAQRPLVIICDGAQEEGLAFLGMNNFRGVFRCCVVKAPDFGDKRVEAMENLSLITGGTYVSDLHGIDIKEVDFSHFGQAKKIIVSKTETTIIDGNKDQVALDAFIADLKMNLTQAKTEEDKYPIEKRIAVLNDSVATIQIGAATETELKEKLDRVDDSVRATRAAIAEGFVAGGGTAFSKIVEPITDATSDVIKGWGLLIDALKAPLKQICENAGVNGEEKLSQIKKETIATVNKDNIGYNVLTDKVEDMVEAGIIDSTKALRCALTNAVSVAGMVLTSECSIICIR